MQICSNEGKRSREGEYYKKGASKLKKSKAGTCKSQSTSWEWLFRSPDFTFVQPIDKAKSVRELMVERRAKWIDSSNLDWLKLQQRSYANPRKEGDGKTTHFLRISNIV